MKLSTFIKKNNVRMESVMVGENPNFDNPDWDAYHYKVTLFHKRRQYSTFYSMGMALCHEPKVDDVLDCLASDCSGVENARDFEDWAADYGYDPDSRTAEKIFKTCKLQSVKLRRLFGDDLYDQLINDTERL